MSWLYSQVLVEEYSEAKCLDGEQCALWNGTHMQQASWLPAKTTKRSTLSRSGMTFKPLTDDLGEAVLMSFLEDFPVRTYPAQEKGPELTESEAVCGDTWQESSMKFDLNTCSWKTHQCLWEEDLPESSVTLPKWGMMRDGVLWERTTLPPLTSGTGFGLLLPRPKAQEPGTTSEAYGDCLNDVVKGRKGWDKKMWPTPRCQMTRPVKIRKDLKKGHKGNLEEVVAVAQSSQMWPTPTRRDYKGTNALEGLTRKDGKSRMDQLPNAVAYKQWPTPCAGDYRSPNLNPCKEGQKIEPASGHALLAKVGGQLNPNWVEWLMGWPIGWTDLNALETDKFLMWPHTHGDSLEDH